MTEPTTPRRLAAAVSVRWTPAMAAHVRRSVQGLAARRKRRRRIAALGLCLLLIGGVGYAFPRLFSLGSSRRAAPTNAPQSAARPAAGATEPAPVIAPGPAPAPALPTESPVPRVAESPRPARAGAVVRPAVSNGTTVAALFAAADAARLEGRYAEAVAPLTEIFTRYPANPRAAIAAFQLGRLLADNLRDPAAAALAFARAAALDPKGPLADDAAARATEALRLARGAKR